MNKEQEEIIKRYDLVEDKTKYPIYRYNDKGKIICKTYSDGTKDTYEYNDKGILICETYKNGIRLIDGKYYKPRVKEMKQ